MYKIGQKLRAEEYTAELVTWLNKQGCYCRDINEKDLVYEIVKCEPVSSEELADIMRAERLYECFPIINRGELWYAQLSEEQKAELSKWYREWLDAPSTLIKPQKPEWLT